MTFPTSPTNNKIPDSIRYHLSDIYIDELEKVVNAQLDTLAEDEDIEIPTTELLDAFINLLAKTPNKVTAKKVTENTFIPILEKFAAGMYIPALGACFMKHCSSLLDAVCSPCSFNLELLFMENQLQRGESDDSEDSEDENRPPFIYDVESLEQALGKAAEDPETYNPNRKKLAELRKRFSELIPGEEAEGDSNEDDDEVPTLVDALEEEEDLEDMEEDDEEARKGGWTNEFTAGDIIGDELVEEEKPRDTRRTKKDNGLLGGKMVSVDSSTIDISGLETEVAPSAQQEPKTKTKKAKKAAAKQPEVEVVEEEETEEITTIAADEDEDEDEDGDDETITATTISKKKKVQWVLDKNTVRRKCSLLVGIMRTFAFVRILLNGIFPSPYCFQVSKSNDQ